MVVWKCGCVVFERLEFESLKFEVWIVYWVRIRDVDIGGSERGDWWLVVVWRYLGC